MAVKEFMGKAYAMEDTVQTISRTEPKLDFYCCQRMGMTAYKDDGVRPIVEANLQAIRVKDELKAGMPLLFHAGFGGMWAVTVDADLLHASGESVFVTLGYDEGHPEFGFPGEWVGLCFGNVKALSKIDFQ